jgi:hypothetical protein
VPLPWLTSSRSSLVFLMPWGFRSNSISLFIQY